MYPIFNYHLRATNLRRLVHSAPWQRQQRIAYADQLSTYHEFSIPERYQYSCLHYLHSAYACFQNSSSGIIKNMNFIDLYHRIVRVFQPTTYSIDNLSYHEKLYQLHHAPIIFPSACHRIPFFGCSDAKIIP